MRNTKEEVLKVKIMKNICQFSKKYEKTTPCMASKIYAKVSNCIK